MAVQVRADPMQMSPPVVMRAAQVKGGKAGMPEQEPPDNKNLKCVKRSKSRHSQGPMKVTHRCWPGAGLLNLDPAPPGCAGDPPREARGEAGYTHGPMTVNYGYWPD